MDVRGQIAARSKTLATELHAAGHGASLCAMSKAVGSVPAAKYLEGRLVALRELGRAEDPGCEAAVVLLGTWRRSLDDVIRRGLGPDWAAYRAGGVDELTELTASWGCETPAVT